MIVDFISRLGDDLANAKKDAPAANEVVNIDVTPLSRDVLPSYRLTSADNSFEVDVFAVSERIKLKRY